MYVTPNEPVIVSIGNQDKMFDTINSAVDFLEQKSRNAQDAVNELPLKERFNKRIFTFCLSHGQYDKIGEFLYRMVYPLKTVKRLRGEDRCYGYDHNGGQHTLTIRISLEELLELKQELITRVNLVKYEGEIVDINVAKEIAIKEHFALPYSILLARIKELEVLRDGLPENESLNSGDCWSIRIRDFWNLEEKIVKQERL